MGITKWSSYINKSTDFDLNGSGNAAISDDGHGLPLEAPLGECSSGSTGLKVVA